MEKEIVWFYGEIKTPPFSENARREAGWLLRRLQKGEKLSLPESRPMPSIGKQCHELRIRDQDSHKIWRIVYRIDHDALIIVEMFAKKDQKTPKYVLENSKNRLSRYDKICKELK